MNKCENCRIKKLCSDYFQFTQLECDIARIQYDLMKIKDKILLCERKW